LEAAEAGSARHIIVLTDGKERAKATSAIRGSKTRLDVGKGIRFARP